MPQTYTFDAVRMENFAETAVACLPHRGPPDRIGDSIRRFIDWRRARGLPPDKAATWNVLYDDPDTTSPEAFRMDICVSCGEVPSNDWGIVPARLAGGRCAVLCHLGSDATLRDAINFLYGEWLSASGEVLRDAPMFLRRVRFFPDVAEHEAETEIYLPLAASTDPEG